MQVISLPSMTTYEVCSVALVRRHERTPMAAERKVRERLCPHPRDQGSASPASPESMVVI